ncbi:MAG TPA: hypothetical protein VF742_02970 [Terracidiphilus sp.]|jgi:hypothetical protein
MQHSTAFAPSPKSDLREDNFAAFLARLATLPDWNADSPNEPVQPEPADVNEADLTEDDLIGLSYESALRAPARAGLSAKISSLSRSEKPAITTRLASALKIAEPRRYRATVRFTVTENELLHTRAAESGLAVSAYVRACVLEVEAMRAQVKQMMAASESRSHSSIEPQAPILPARPAQPYLAAPAETNSVSRPMQQAAAHPPRPVATRRLDPRVQAAFDAQRQLSTQSAQKPQQKARTGLLGFLFGAGRSV